MKRKHTLIIASLMLALLAMAIMFWVNSVESRPTLMYFRADL